MRLLIIACFISGCSLSFDLDAVRLQDPCTDCGDTGADLNDVRTNPDSSDLPTGDVEPDFISDSSDMQLAVSCEDVGFDGGTLVVNAGTNDTSNCYKCSYFIDPDKGSDMSSGRTREEAFATFAPWIMEESLGRTFSGEAVCAKRGTHNFIQSELYLRVSGGDTQTTIGSYGPISETPPILDFGGRIVDPVTVGGITNGTFSLRDGREVWANDVLTMASDETLTDGDAFIEGENVSVRVPQGLSIADVRVLSNRGIEVSANRTTRVLTSNVAIRDVTIQYARALVFVSGFYGPVDGVVINNIVGNFGTTGVLLDYPNGEKLANIEVSQSEFNQTYSGVLTEGTETAGVEDIKILDNLFRPHSLSSFTTASIVLAALRTVDVSGNSFFGVAGQDQTAVRIGGTQRVFGLRFERNAIYDYRFGVVFDTGNQPFEETVVKNNIIAGCDLAVEFRPGLDFSVLSFESNTLSNYQTGLRASASLENLTFSNNVLNSDRPAVVHVNTTEADGDYFYNYFYPDGPFDVAGTVTNFSNWGVEKTESFVGEVSCVGNNVTSAIDLTPIEGSPCIDSGDPELLGLDFFGNDRQPNPDIGAIER